MRGYEPLGQALSYADRLTARLSNACLEAYNDELTDMFARLHSTNPETHQRDEEAYEAYKRNFEYKQDADYQGYQRFAFERQSEMENFVKYANKAGVETVYVPVKLGGRYYVEISESVVLENPKTREQYKASAQAFAEKFSQETGYDKPSMNWKEDTYQAFKERHAPEKTVMQSEVEQGIMEDADLVGAKRKATAVIRELEYYRAKYDPDTALRSDLTYNYKTGKKEYDPNTGTGVGRHNADALSSFNEEVGVKVIHNGSQTIMIKDGSVVTDAAMIARVTAADTARRERAAVVDGRLHDRTDFHLSPTQKRMQINSAHIVASHTQVYYAETRGGGRYSAGHLDSFRDRLGGEQAIMSHLDTKVLMDKDAVEALTAYTQSRSYGKFERTGLKHAEFTTRQMETLAKLQAMAAGTTAAVAGDTALANTTFKNGGKEVITLTAEDRINLYEMTRKVGYEMRNELLPADVQLTQAQRASLQSAENSARPFGHNHREYNLPSDAFFGEEKLTAFRTNAALAEDLGIDLRHELKQGRVLTLREMQNFTDLGTMRALADMGVTYNQVEGRFFHNGKALDRTEFNCFLDSLSRKEIKDYFAGEGAISRAVAGGRLGDHFGEGDKGASKFFHKTGEDYGFKMDASGKVTHFRAKMETTHFDILNIDKAVLTKLAMGVDKNGKKIDSINLLTKSGKIDVKALKAITPEMLKAHGISKETWSAFCELHLDGRGKLIEIGKLKSGALLGLAPFTKAGMKMLGKTGDQETNQFVGNMQTLSSGAGHIKDAHNAIIQADQRRKEIRDARRASRINSGDAGNAKKLGEEVKKKKPSKKAQRERDYIAKKGAADSKAIEKFVKREEHQAKMVASSKKRTEVMRRLNIKQRAAEKFAQTKVGGALTKLSKAVSKFIAGALGTVAAMAGLLVLLLWGILVLVIVVIMIIQSLTSLPFKGLKAVASAWASLTGEEPAVVELMKICNDREDEWLEGLQDYDEVFENRKELQYTLNYVSYEDYIASNPSLVLVDGELYIDPFHGSGTAESHKEVLTPVTSFNGANDLDLVTNPSVYSQKNTSTDGSIIAVENGHTSNVKDILAMTDCMYQFDIQGSGDDSLQSIMNEPPAVINFENFYNKTIGTIKFVANVIGTAAKNFWNWLTGGDDSEEYPSIDDYWGGTVKFGTIQNYVENLFAASHQEQFQFAVSYPTCANTVMINGVTVDISSMPQDIASELGYCVNPITNNFYLGWDSSTTSVSKVFPCLADGTNLAAINITNVNDIRLTMAEYAGTPEEQCVWTSMGSNQETYNRIKSHHCWTNNLNSDDASITYTAYSDFHNDESYSKNEAEQRAIANASGFHPDTNTYNLSPDANSMTIREWVAGYTIVSSTVDKYEVDDGDTEEDSGVPDDPDTPEDESKKTVHHSHWEYKASATVTLGHYHNEGYTRTCQGDHPFSYSGGVVSCQAKGVVYSTTNEQLAMTGMYENEALAPRALDFDLNDRGFRDFKGCHIKSEIIYDTPLQASQSGGTVLPAFDPQGSYVANRGLNLYMDGENLSTDINCRSDVAAYLLRDIFDCDCRLDKGRNVFPWKSCDYHYYEGWSADNMMFVCSRVAVDWNDLYEFDIPLEVKEPSLSEEDIEWFMTALETEYGGNFTESRRQAIELILHWVGKGHYSKDHTDHNFLENACHSHTGTIMVGGESFTTSYDGCCTASDAWGFMSYILAAEGRPTTKPTNHYTTYTSLKPADYVFKNISGDYSNFGCIGDDMLTSPTAFTWTAISEALGEAHREAGCFYIGTFNNDSLFDDTGTYTLQNGYVIHKGVPVTVGMDGTVDKGCGTVLLRSEPVSTTNPNDWSDTTNYFWFVDPSLVDSWCVKYQSFE